MRIIRGAQVHQAPASTGTVFHLVDSLEQGCIGLLCCGVDVAEALAYYSAGVMFLQDNIGGRGIQDVRGEAQPSGTIIF